MKRISTYVLAGAFALGSVGTAAAFDMKVKGQWDFAFGWADNVQFADHENKNGRGATTDPFLAAQRVRTQINFIVSEQLQGVLQFEIGDVFYGDKKTGGALGTDGVNVETKHAYLDWLIPQTDVAVRMGLQPIALPSAMGSPILDDDIAGVTITAPINDMFGVTAFWARPIDADAYNSGVEHHDDEMDLFGLLLPVTGDGWKVTPWAVYAQIGNFSDFDGMTAISTSENTNTEGWYAGGNFELTMFDPLTFKADVMYGDIHKMEDKFGTRGWFVDAAIDYKLDWATPGIFGWWASGDGDGVKDGQFGRLPQISNSAGFAPTSFGFDGGYGIGTCDIVSMSGAGTWGVGAQLAEMSFVEDLTHTLRVAYYQGTNDEDAVGYGADAFDQHGNEAVYLTDKDYGFEVNFDHQYKIYENLTAAVELGYVHLELDEDVWGTDETEDAWKAQLHFQYTF